MKSKATKGEKGFYELGDGCVSCQFLNFSEGAEQGDPYAQYKLAVMYAKGRGVPQDFAQAVAWYRKAAEQGDPYAQFWLGVMYAKGRGVPQDFAQAVAWWRKAAEQGHPYAQCELGVMAHRSSQEQHAAVSPRIVRVNTQSVQWSYTKR
jgi:TPR repeat protein